MLVFLTLPRRTIATASNEIDGDQLPNSDRPPSERTPTGLFDNSVLTAVNLITFTLLLRRNMELVNRVKSYRNSSGSPSDESFFADLRRRVNTDRNYKFLPRTLSSSLSSVILGHLSLSPRCFGGSCMSSHEVPSDEDWNTFI